MKLIFEESRPGRKLGLLPECDVEKYEIKAPKRALKLHLPEMAKAELLLTSRQKRNFHQGIFMMILYL